MDTPLDKLTEQFRRLPGIGVKTARKLAYYIVQQPNSRVDEFVDAIRDAKQNMHFCSVCFNLSSQDPCPICSDISRDRSTICVVETPQDVQAIERSGDYHGLYHVLHGALSPLDGVNVEDLRIRELLQRLGNTTVKEVIRRGRRSDGVISGPPHQDGRHPRNPHCPRPSYGRRH